MIAALEQARQDEREALLLELDRIRRTGLERDQALEACRREVERLNGELAAAVAAAERREPERHGIDRAYRSLTRGTGRLTLAAGLLILRRGRSLTRLRLRKPARR
jgi:hypothetical protein